MTLLSRRHDVFGAGSALFYREPLHIVRGRGVTLYDESGNEYIDMYNNVPCVGHCHPHVVQAVQAQVSQLNVHSRYLHAAIVDYGQRLLDKHAANLDCIVFACTGTEANEIALQIAKSATKGRGFIATDAGYHGNSTEVRKLNRPKQDGGEFRSIPFPESYRCDASNPTEYFLDQVKSAIDGFVRDGIPLAGMVFMLEATRLVHEAGGLVVADEVQAGLCRTGKWWGYETEGFLPDIVTMGKPLGAGVPLAATAASRALIEDFRQQTRYFNTFAASPLQGAAGNAVLDVLESEALHSNALIIGNWLVEELSRLLRGHPSVGQVRGKGLFVAVEWVKTLDSKQPDREGALRIVEALKKQGYLIGAAGKFGNVLKLRPPLVFDSNDAVRFVDTLENVL